MSQQYSLRWNNHQPNFISMFTTLLNSQTLVDVTLAAEGKHLLAHKVVLSACSTYFQALFIDNPSRHPIVILKDVTFANLRTIVDFMYCGEVNVTQESLTQVLDTAKLLKIKGLTDMPPDSTLSTVPRSQNEFNDTTDRHSASPATSTESRKRKRSRKCSTGSTHLNMVPDDTGDEQGQMDVMRSDAITLSSVPQRRSVENAQQTNADQHNLVDVPMMDGSAGVPQGGQWSMVEHTYPRYTNACLGGGALQSDAALYMNNVMNPHMNAELDFSSQASVKLRRSKYFKRQSRVQPDDREVHKQLSEPTPAVPSPPMLQKHESYPQYSSKKRRMRTLDHEVGSLLIRAVSAIERQPSTSTSSDAEAAQSQRASHTPAVRSGPPLSCNFCWNTVDECGRILRRKTKYHCPECRTNLCIVPCFHEYHESTSAEASAR